MITARNTRWDLSDSRREGTSFPAPRPCLPPAAAAQLPASGCQHHSGPSEIHRWILIWVQNPAESTQLGCITDVCCTCVSGKPLCAFLVTSCSSCTPAAPSTYTWTRRATNHAGEPGFPGPGAGRSSLPQPGISGEHQTLPASPTSTVFSHQVQQKEGSDPQPPAAPAIPPPSTSHQRAAVAAAPHGSTSSFCVSFCREAPLWLHQPDPEDPL